MISQPLSLSFLPLQSDNLRIFLTPGFNNQVELLPEIQPSFIWFDRIPVHGVFRGHLEIETPHHSCDVEEEGFFGEMDTWTLVRKT